MSLSGFFVPDTAHQQFGTYRIRGNFTREGIPTRPQSLQQT